jgi:short-subunit dehydrogenase
MSESPQTHFKVALITGAGSGIGQQLALALAGMGCSIAAVDCRERGLKELEEQIAAKNGRCACAVLDVTDAVRLQTGVEELEKSLGPIDLLIASAGVGLETSAMDYRADVMNTVLNVNLLGVSNSIAAVLPGMLQRRRGHVVALSSLASFRGLPRMLGYCASKAGINALMEGLRVEVEIHGVNVTTVCPGWVKTPMTTQIGGKVPHMLEADEAARIIITAIHRRRRFYAFPKSMVWYMRMLNWLPSFARDRLLRVSMRSMNRKAN